MPQPNWVPLTDHPGYFFEYSSNMIIYKRNDFLIDIVCPYVKNGDAYIQLSGKEFLYAKILLQEWYGYSEFPPLYKNGIKLDMSKSNLRYKIDSIKLANGDLFINETQFKRIPDYPNFYISDRGLVYNLEKRRFCKIRRMIDYQYCEVSKNHYEAVHRLVYKAWKENIDNSVLIHHKDNIKHHPFLWNLEKSSSFENTRKAIIDGLKPTFFQLNEIEQIAKYYSEGFSPYDITIKLGIDQCESNYKRIRAIIYKMKLGNSYFDIGHKYGIDRLEIPSKKVLNEEKVIEICKMMNMGISSNKISKMFNVSQNCIHKIKNRKTWKDITDKYLK